AGWLTYRIGGSPGIRDGLMALAAAAAGLPIAREAWGRLRAKQSSIALLVTVAAVGALWIGEAWEAAAVTFLYAVGGYLENLTLARTRAALRTLVDLAPCTARIQRGDGLATVPVHQVGPGDVVVVLPGDRVPVDGTVQSGRAALDTAALTGEPLPAEVGPGDEVLGGRGNREVKPERVARDTTLGDRLHLEAEAEGQKPRVQRFLDRFAQRYTPAIMAAAAGMYLMTGDVALALTFLVIGCPGALVVAAPV